MDWNDTDHIDPGGHWLGWRLRGRYLISPDGDRITPERLRGFLFTEALRARYARQRFSGGGLAVLRDAQVAVAAHLRPAQDDAR